MNSKLITTFVILIFAIFIGFFFAFPKFGKVQSMRVDLAETSEALEEMLGKMNATKIAIADFEGLEKEQIELVQDALPQDIDLPNLFILLEFIISSSGLVSESVAVQVLESNRRTDLLADRADAERLRGIDTKSVPRDIEGLVQRQFSDPLESARVDLTIIGSYESFKVFLGILEKSLRIFDVESISFSSPRQTKEGLERFRFSLVLKTYFSE